MVVEPFIFHDDTTDVPLGLPKLSVKMNLIPVGVISLGWAVSSLLMTLCLLLGAWIYKYRRKEGE